ncbi:hypothetical protein [Streptomyces sp. MS1.AVA.4]|uniref:Uncharacterized protein n=1 Tax=Streptomyces pratisoli TaxID=3139917 RepID=A0ACC6QB60_9ACTN
MNRDDLESALDRDDSTSARAALAELEAGADVERFQNRTAAARQLWDVWSHGSAARSGDILTCPTSQVPV